MVASLGLGEAHFPRGVPAESPPSPSADDTLQPALAMAFTVLLPALTLQPLIGTVCEVVKSFPWGRFY